MWTKVERKSCLLVLDLLLEVLSPHQLPNELVLQIASHLPQTPCKHCKTVHGSQGRYKCKNCNQSCEKWALHRVLDLYLCDDCNVRENWTLEEWYEYQNMFFDAMERRLRCSCTGVCRRRKGIASITQLDMCPTSNEKYAETKEPVFFCWRFDPVLNGDLGDEFYDRKEELGKKILKEQYRITRPKI
ncbi:hypothetical protein BDR26DRAFT_861248, partial [Obelidium mucronatum]